MNDYTVSINWRGFRWNLTGRAFNSVALVAGLAGEIGPDARIVVTRQ